MINFDDIKGENVQEHNPYKRQIPEINNIFLYSKDLV